MAKDRPSEAQVVQPLSDRTAWFEQIPDQGPIITGTIDIRKTHPALYRVIMLYALACFLLGINFWIFTPTFLVWDQPNELWGSIFILLSVAKVVFLNIHRSLKLVRVTMAFEVGYFMFFALGTSQPPIEGTGSFQLPIMYLWVAAIEYPLLVEPFINQLTARRD